MKLTWAPVGRRTGNKESPCHGKTNSDQGGLFHSKLMATVTIYLASVLLQNKRSPAFVHMHFIAIPSFFISPTSWDTQQFSLLECVRQGWPVHPVPHRGSMSSEHGHSAQVTEPRSLRSSSGSTSGLGGRGRAPIQHGPWAKKRFEQVSTTSGSLSTITWIRKDPKLQNNDTWS